MPSTSMHKLNFFFLTRMSKLASWKKRGALCAGFQHLSLLSQESVLSCRVSAGLCVIIASRVVIHNMLAANWAEKTHSRVGKYTRTPHGRTHPKHGSHPAALRVSGAQSLQLQVSHKHSANSMKSSGVPASDKFTKGKEYAVSTLLTAHCKVMRIQP